MDKDSFQSTFQLAAGIVSLTAKDEVAGVDEAMGQPGVVVTKGLTLRFEGDTSKSTGSVEAVVTGQAQGSEVAIYVNGSSKSFSALQMQKSGDTVELQGGAVQQSKLGVAGYVIAGELA
jgi:transcription elongation GreA/GreB family factor